MEYPDSQSIRSPSRVVQINRDRPHHDTAGIRLLSVLSFCLPLATSRISAQSWVAADAPNLAWHGVACSADGRKQIAVVYGGDIYTSTNGGANWTPTSAAILNTNWFCAASSADGTRLVAAANSIGSAPICVSTDSGATWNVTTAPNFNMNWRSVASSGDGRVLAASSYGFIYVSTNYGASWFKTGAPSKQWTCIAVSANGGSMVSCTAGTAPTPIYASTNYGIDWSTNGAPTTNSWESVAMSADGTQLVAVAYLRPICRSGDGGVTWTNAGTYRDNWASVASSADGSRFVACSTGSGGGPKVYKDFGATGIAFSYNPGNWWTVTCSADGGRMAGVIQSGPAYFATLPVARPMLHADRSSSQCVVSWMIPSSPFQLLHNSALNTTNWIGVTNTPVIVTTNLAFQVTLNISPTADFYRLVSK